jgi:hypothetical protein
MKPGWPAAYAADFVSYLLQKLTPDELALVEQIVLFGSAARAEATAESDVDVLVQTSAREPLRKRITKLVEDFEASARVRDHWKVLGVRLPLSLKIGQPTDWDVVPAAISEHGLVLYGPYRPPAGRGRSGAVFCWENIPSPRVRVNLFRNLFGYVSHGKRYPGLVHELKGQRLTKGAIWIPVEHLPRVQRLFRTHGVTYRVVTIAKEPARARGAG